jgi:Carboxypeptidase regulatory-like domain
VKQGYRSLFGSFALAALVLALVFVGQTSAQVISGDLVGTVFDKTGAAVPGANVEAVNAETGVKYTAEANATGEYRFNNLPVGTYNVSAWANNFAKTTVNAFRVELNKTSTLSITLEIKGAVTSIEVSGAAVALDTTTATVSTTFDERLTQDLPSASVGSGVLNLSLLGSGVASSGGVGAGSGPSVGGQRPRNNNFTIEGVDNNSKSVTGPLVGIPNDAVAEISILQNQYSPEFGHSSGGQFNTIIKSGTNSFHGGTYIYSRNRNFDAVDVSLKNQGILSNPRYDNNRMGGDVGGPILKNKLFFFGTLEYNPVGQASVSASALCSPTSAGFTTLSGISGVNATNLGILQKYSAPAAAATGCGSVPAKDPSGAASADQIFIQNPSGTIVDKGGVHWTGIPVGVNPVQAPNFTNNWAVLGSIDYNVSTSDQLRGRYIYNRSVGLDFSPSLPAFFLPAPTKNHLVTINEYHTFRPNLTNEFRIGYNRFTNVTDTGNFQFPGLDSFPNLEFFDLNLQIGPDPNGPQFTIQNLYQMADTLSWTKGHHTLKFGIEGRKYISPQSFTQRSRGDYDYVTLDLYLRDQFPDFLAERSLGNPVYYGDQSAVYWFANDDWRIRPNFSVNFGVRYEYTTIPTGERLQKLNQDATVPGLVDFSEPRAAKNNWGPRVGFAYSPGTSGRTSIRAGFGISYDVLYDNIGILSLPPQLSGTVDCAPPLHDPTCPANGVFLASGGIPPTSGGFVTFPSLAAQKAATANHVVVDQLDPKSIQWTLGVQHTFWKDYTVEVRYLGTRGLHLNTQERINRQAKTTDSVFLPTYLQNPGQAALDALPVTLAQINANSSLVPAYKAAGFTTSLVQFTPNGDSIYHGLATQVTKRMNHGLQFIGSYTWSHTIDDSTADFFTTVLTPRRTQDFQNLGNDRSNSALDRRHRFTMAVLYDMPYFQHSNWAVKNIVGNWVIAPVYTYQTGEWATVESNRDVNLNGDAAGDRVIFNSAGVKNTGTDVFALFSTNTCSSLPADQQSACFTAHTVAYQVNDPTAQYIRGRAGALATVGRNTLLTRPINNFDLTAVKRFSLTERYKIEFSANAFNLLNHPQFVPGSLNDVASIGYTGSGVSNYLTPGNTVFNRPDQTFASNARTLQLGLKVKF